MDAQVRGRKIVKEVVHGKRQKFVHLAQSRTVNAIRAIGNKSHYEYDDADVKKIVGSLAKEVEALKVRLGDKPARDEVDFKL